MSEQKTIISIIVPVYNAVSTLERCVNSIIQQSFTDFELILINDCSTDYSKQLCDKLSLSDKRIKVIHLEKNSGVSAARNTGIEYAIGEYIMFADSDDYVDKDWCRILYQLIVKEPNALIASNIYIDNGQHIYKQNTINEKCDQPQTIDYFTLYKMNLSGYPVNKIYRRNILNKYNIRFPTNIHACEDVIFNTTYISNCSSIIYTKKTLYYYWTNPSSATNSYNQDALLLNLKAFTARLPLIEEKDITSFCDIYFPCFIGLFNNIFDTKCKLSFFQKIKYNHSIMKSREFRFCVEHISPNENSKLLLKVIKTYNYYFLYVFQQCYRLKSILNKKTK